MNIKFKIHFGFFLLLFVSFLLCSRAPVNQSQAAGKGKAGSFSRFAIIKDRLFTIDKQKIRVFDISDVFSPVYKYFFRVSGKKKKKQFPQHINSRWRYLKTNVETLFPFHNYILVGTNTGMFIYSYKVGYVPEFISEYKHIRACDPVVAQNNTAYITLRSESGKCYNNTNELQIIDISNIFHPQLIKKYDMQNPKGLSIDYPFLFVADIDVKVFDVTNSKNIKPIEVINSGSKSYDLITENKILYSITEDAFYQYSYKKFPVSQLSVIFFAPPQEEVSNINGIQENDNFWDSILKYELIILGVISTLLIFLGTLYFILLIIQDIHRKFFQK